MNECDKIRWRSLLARSFEPRDADQFYDDPERRTDPAMTNLPPLRPGDAVRLNTPDNLTLHGAPAKVVEVTDWGAHVATAAAATGRFRALYDEMDRDGPELLVAGYADPVILGGAETSVGLTVPAAVGIVAAKAITGNGHAAAGKAQSKGKGYSGDACDQCGSFKMRRNGTCLLCDDCGATSGCS